MLRSQSISNLNEQRKSKMGFLSSLRSRKSSSNDLHSKLISEPSNMQKNKPRPLSLSVSSINLNQKFHEPVDQNSYSSNVSKQRQGSISIEDKENISVIPRLKSRRNLHNTAEGRTLKTRSSAPNLNKGKRSSMFTGSVASTPMINIFPDSNNNIIDESSIESPEFVSPETITDNSDSLFASPIHLELIDDEFSDEDLQSRKLHRTTNLTNINDFIRLIDDGEKYQSVNYLPINNRKSLDFEKFERNKIRKSLQDNLDRECSTNFISNLSLVENAVFLSIEKYQKSQSDFMNFLEDDDYINSIKNDPYDNEPDEYYLTF
ncbi:uncharacterized protein AC631_05255 [Debaryomyces fabryi]|uniref:Uncharacterized protein n=1 Tax=Debaryomyces fabryi TaxID=58627 RepID=A0A0V1PS50_9ASCO|nr:uncharacterized protein AC631_05255 [Debaryomyces fabryi]KRZ98993.1 hypothetical protein AC631_05255 [Debaryomyces fabryi]CUM45503.1 unnamed protein product [Debaryomyces fabryi]